MKRFFVFIISVCFIAGFSFAGAQEAPKESAAIQEPKYIATPNEYKVGIEDVLDISVLQPEKLTTMVTVSPDGSIVFPYIGNVNVKGLVLVEIQNQIQARLADGYMKYPVVSVSLKESRSKKFFVYGEVMKPGTYYLEDKTTVLKAISMVGGFTKYGSSSRVKVLRPKKDDAGYESIKVNIKAVMDGATDADILLMPEDMVVVSEGVF
ncbi:MAG: polysaccharide export protein [Candidatus Omnitrophica bacterium]|nr:polysaccharide export protein [Candidatus Omnitrophota bacterium]